MGRVIFAGTERTPIAPEWDFKNESSEQIPPYGVMRVTGFDVTTDPEYPRLLVNKPNTYGAQYSHAINGDLCVEAGQTGRCTLGGISAAKYDDGDGTPAFSELWGPRNGSWKLKKNTQGFAVLGIASSARKLVLVRPAPFLVGIGKADGAISQNNSGTVSVWAGTTLGSEGDTGENITVYSRFGDIESGAWVMYRWVPESNGFEGIQTPCP